MMETWERHLLTSLIDILVIIIIMIIIKSGYKNIFTNHKTYTYIIEPTIFIRKLAFYGACCCIVGVIADFIHHIAFVFYYFDIINFYQTKHIKLFKLLTYTPCIFGIFFYFSLIINLLQLQMMVKIG